MKASTTYLYLLRKTPFFTALTHEQLRWTIDHSKEWEAYAGTVVAECGPAVSDDAYWILLDGRWQVERDGHTASPTQPQIGPQYGSTGSAGTICPSGNCGAVNTTVTPMTRDQLADSAASVSTAAGRFGAVTGAAAEIPTPYSPAFATAAFAATVAGWIAGGVEQVARPNPRPYISGGLVDIGNYLVSDRFPMAGPAINEVGEAIKGSSWMDQFNKGTKK